MGPVSGTFREPRPPPAMVCMRVWTGSAPLSPRRRLEEVEMFRKGRKRHKTITMAGTPFEIVNSQFGHELLEAEGNPNRVCRICSVYGMLGCPDSRFNVGSSSDVNN